MWARLYRRGGSLVRQLHPQAETVDEAKLHAAIAAELDPQAYLEAFPDVAQSGADPLWHAVRHGAAEGRLSRMGLLDRSRYRRGNDATVSDRDLILEEGRLLSVEAQSDSARLKAAIAAGFDSQAYLKLYRDVAASGADPLQHAVEHGAAESRLSRMGLLDRSKYARGKDPGVSDRDLILEEGRLIRLEAQSDDDKLRDAILAAGFDPQEYLKVFPELAAAGVDPLRHVVRHGAAENRLTRMGLLDRIRYAQGSDKAVSDRDLILTEGRLLRLDPRSDDARLQAALFADFDPDAYLKAFPELAAAGVNPLRHVVRHGAADNRLSRMGLLDRSRYTRGSDPSVSDRDLILEEGRLLRAQSETDEAVVERVKELLDLLGLPFSAAISETLSRYAVAMFDAEAYRERHTLDPDLTPGDLLARYILVHYPRGEAPGLFDEEHYRAVLAREGLRIEPPHTAFQHWLNVGLPRRISPTPLFDEEEYLKLNPDLALYSGWLFEHWLTRGLADKRRFDRNISVAPGAFTGKGLTGFARMASRTPGYAAAIRDMRSFRTSDTFERLVAEASAIDPNIRQVGKSTNSLIPPLHDEVYAAYCGALRLIPEGEFDALVLMPFCKLGGADFVAGVFARSLVACGARTLVLRTDASDFDRPDWFPPDVPTVDISAAMKAMPEPLRPRGLYEIIRATGAPLTVNINSRLAFETFSMFGARLRLLTDLYCYFFCSDQTPSGEETGYPVWYFAQLLSDLQGALLDTHYLADVLTRRYALAPAQAGKLKVLYTPMSGPPATQEPASTDRKTRKARRILWAGRFDRQKRFDLLVEVARRMPDVEFEAWGKAVLEQPPDLSDLPDNLKIHPPYGTLSELPVFEADGWLYTSVWDGMPTILIEIAKFGIPVVASAVGGVPELIDDTTGWPLAPDADAAETVATLEAMLADEEARRQRGRALKERVTIQHRREAYDAAVREIATAAGVGHA